MSMEAASVKPIELLDKREYLIDVTKKISAAKAGSRITLMSMTFEPAEEPLVSKLMAAACAAADRGAKITVLIDAHTFMVSTKEHLTGPLLTSRDTTKGNRGYKTKMHVLETLREHGGRFVIINNPGRRFSNPFAGRSHIKLAVIDDDSYVGGCNLSQLQVDAMVHLAEPKVADWLYDFAGQVADIGSVREALLDSDQTFSIRDNESLLIDAGVPDQSLIYDETLQLIDNANEWIVFTCQFFPNGETVRRLAQALERGVHVYLFYNHPSKHAHVNKLAHHLVLLQERSKWPRDLFRRQIAKKGERLHAKIIATEKAALVGSHNMVPVGVHFGTAEIAFQRNDPDFARTVAHFVTQKLGVGDVV
jgi:phosphatidylserine/phosphatidylglycerophosphate/cardiolipin synthase-like enzyme